MRDLTGKTLGQYQVLELLGEGGMARVYKVWDKVRSTHLALKLLHEDLAEDKIFIRRFQREAQTLERLQHPNIVRFYGLERQGIQAFIVVDFIDGFTLRTEVARMEGHAMSAGRIMEVMRPVCSALHYAHSQGIIHCDIKPANIMLSRNGTVLVSDFGIARVTEGTATMTMAGAGTPAYMAPEQIMGSAPSPQTDIYGLGVVLFEMLTGGERPFTGEKAKVTGTSGEKVRWEHINLSPLSPREFNKEVPLDLEAVVMKCLDKDPSRRYSSPMELLSALDKALANYKVRTYPGTRLTAAEDITLPPAPGGVTTSLPLTPSSPAPKEVEPSRKPGWVWGIGILIVLLCIGGVATVLLLNEFPITIMNGDSNTFADAVTQTPLPTYTPLPTFTALPSDAAPTDALVVPPTPTMAAPVLPKMPTNFYINATCTKVIAHSFVDYKYVFVARMQWDAVSSGVTGFEVNKDGVLLAALDANATEYEDSITILTPYKRYSAEVIYTIQAVNEAGKSEAAEVYVTITCR